MQKHSEGLRGRIGTSTGSVGQTTIIVSSEPLKRWNSVHGARMRTRSESGSPGRTIPRLEELRASESLSCTLPPPPQFPRRRFSVWSALIFFALIILFIYLLFVYFVRGGFAIVRILDI